MAKNSAIEWTDATHNFWYGCQKISPGCAHCYAEREMKRFGRDFKTVIRAKGFDKPLRWHKPLRVFVNSWSDFFIEEADTWRDKAWGIIQDTPHLTYLILTKRPHNIRGRLPEDWGKGYPNVWLGVSAENQEMADKRIPLLLEVPTQVHFVSAEPLLSNIDFSPWLGNNPSHEQHQESGGASLQSGAAGRVGDRLNGPNLADRKAGMGPLEEADSHKQMQTSESGTSLAERISTDKGNDRRDETQRACSSSGLETHSGSDPKRISDEPQEWDEIRQQAVEPRSGHKIGKRAARSTSSESRPVRGPRGRKESRSQTYIQTSFGDKEAPSDRRIAEDNSRRFQRELPDNFKDSPRRSLAKISWLITGGESGPSARPMNLEWARQIRDHCQQYGVAYFHKQNGGSKKIDGHWGGNELDGKIYQEVPDGFRNGN